MRDYPILCVNGDNGYNDKTTIMTTITIKIKKRKLNLDGVAPLTTDPPLTSFTTLSKKIKRKKLHLTLDK